jgi:ATP synthase protein I
MAASSNPPPDGDGHGQSGVITPAEREAFKRRADEIGKRLDAAKGEIATGKSETQPKPQPGRKPGVDGSSMGAAMRISTELLGGIVVGAGIGWLLDWALKTGPLFFIVFFLLGAGAGMLNVIRSSGSLNAAPQPGKPAPQAVKDDDEEN